MKVLVLSDTHLGARRRLDRMPPEVWAMADDADVVLHAGDVCDAGGARCRWASARARARGARQQRPQPAGPAARGAAGRARRRRRLGMIHDSGAHRRRGRAGADGSAGSRTPTSVMFGHSHDARSGRDGSRAARCWSTPGSPTQRRRQPVHTVASGSSWSAGEVLERPRSCEVGTARSGRDGAEDPLPHRDALQGGGVAEGVHVVVDPLDLRHQAIGSPGQPKNWVKSSICSSVGTAS